jgi:DNA-directed RNA polymerase subunit M/transcription elongation factor TFIIS
MTLDYTCPHCGARETYSLVPTERSAEAEAPARPAPELDFTCASCGGTETFQLVKT